MIKKGFRTAAESVFSKRTIKLIQFDLLRLRARAKRLGDREVVPAERRLHLGCGQRKVSGWLNVDVAGSDYDVDLAGGALPWKDNAFEVAVSQHVIEHLDLREEALPLLYELHRVLKPGGALWLSCPSIEKICRSYLEHGMKDQVEGKKRRFPHYEVGEESRSAGPGVLQGVPSSYMVNEFFYQRSEHRNLFDFDLLQWALATTGFTNLERTAEEHFLNRCPRFPSRDDDVVTLYVRAQVE